MTTIITADGPSEEVSSWKRTVAPWMNQGKVTREPDGIMTNAERNKKVTTNNKMEFIAWITEEELEALETDEKTSKLETVIKLQTTRRDIKRRTKKTAKRPHMQTKQRKAPHKTADRTATKRTSQCTSLEIHSKHTPKNSRKK
jgi:hypothetical protein